ncbi:hypothetical protein ACGFMM_03145 [Streptomyces sp. NPDC048604]|uniref:SCO2583 family membrane protein n=1 Tax=Streptomyces sp. NPDC048604 TaxID=3365578 RepID=UPI00371534E8
MAGRGDPPEGTPEGLPGGGEDEYRSVVFDESFVRAARLQEFSAQERMGEHARAVRSRPGGEPGRRSRQPVVLVLLILLAFGTAIYLGVRNPYQPPAVHRAEPLWTTVTPLAPQGPVPGGEPAELLSHSPAAEYHAGAAGINLPNAGRTEHFSESQVVTALSVAKDYLVASSLAPDVLSGATTRPVRLLIDPDQQAQFDRSVDASRADGRHALAGWLISFDPARATVDPATRVQGTLRFAEIDADLLQVTADHSFTYTLRPAASGPERAASLFTVHRQLQFRFDREDLRMHRAELLTSQVAAGPQACAPDAGGTLRPLLAGERTPPADAPAVTDPYATGDRAVTPLCGTLAPNAQPRL